MSITLIICSCLLLPKAGGYSWEPLQSGILSKFLNALIQMVVGR